MCLVRTCLLKDAAEFETDEAPVGTTNWIG